MSHTRGVTSQALIQDGSAQSCASVSAVKSRHCLGKSYFPSTLNIFASSLNSDKIYFITVTFFSSVQTKHYATMLVVSSVGKRRFSIRGHVIFSISLSPSGGETVRPYYI